MSRNKYSELHALHEQLRTAQPVVSEPASKRDTTAQHFESLISRSLGDKLNPPRVTEPLGDNENLKSSAQVAVMSPAKVAGDKTDLAGVVTPCTPAAVKRQRLPKGKGMIHKIFFRVTKAEYEEKSSEAKAYGISLSEWARSAFLGYPLPQTRETEKVYRKVLVAFSRATTLLNQIAHKANGGEQVTSDVAEIKGEMLPIIRKFRQLVDLEPS